MSSAAWWKWPWFRRRERKPLTKEQIVEFAEVIERFVSGRTKMYEWDDFECTPIRDPELDELRIECVDVHRKYPPEREGTFCNDEGLAELRRIAARMRQIAETRNPETKSP